MRILWVKVGGLWPLNSGGRLRSFHLISELSRRHRVTVLTTHGTHDDPGGLPTVLPFCNDVISVPHAVPKAGTPPFAWALIRSWLSPLPVDLWKWRLPTLRRKVRELVLSGNIDLCVADFLSAASNMILDRRVPMVLFEHNVEHMIWKRLSSVEIRPARRALLEMEWRKMRRYEAQACTRASLTIAVSETDRETLLACAPGARVSSIPTGVDTSYFIPNGDRESPSSLVFTGSMDWYPNEDAVLHFANAILPVIRREVPDVCLTVVGRHPSARLRAVASSAALHITGSVDDVRPYVAKAAVYVVPLRVGGGTRLKIFEALAMGKAVVTTTIGAEGLPLVSGEHLIQVDDPVSFARSVVSLLRDPARRRSLGAAGRRLVEEQYSWNHVAHHFETMCERVVNEHAR